MRALLPLAAVFTVLGCSRHAPSPPATLHYVVGQGYQLGGVWHYPRESFRYDATGLAERLPDRTGLTADGEAFDPEAMAGAHQTLQLPTIARVTNLENGRQIEVRLNDRGPPNPGRIIGLTRRAADLLGLPPSGAAQVRVQVEDLPSQALRDRLQGAPKGIVAAPLEAVVAENLPPPGEAAPVRRTRVAPPTLLAAAEPNVPDRLPAVVRQGSAHPGQLWIAAGQFSQAHYANALKSELSPLPVQVRREAASRASRYSVMVGPFASVASADAALDQARAAGVSDAVIVVE